MNGPILDYDLVLALDKGMAMGATHMFVMRQHMGHTCDRNESCRRNFYVMPNEDLAEEIVKQDGKLIETHDLSKPRDPIANTRKATYEFFD